VTRDELLQARVQWLASAVRGLLKAHYDKSFNGPYEQSSAGRVDAELKAEEETAELDLGIVALRFLRKKAQQALEDFIRERL